VVNLLVAGGSGFLGRTITRQAQLAGHRVTATYHRCGPPPAGDVDWRRLDIRCRDEVTALARLARPDAVINAAYQQSDWATTADGGAHVALAAGTAAGVLYTDEVRCPVHVVDLALALLELAGAPHAGTCHVAGPDAVSRHELGLLIAARDGLDPAAPGPA